VRRSGWLTLLALASGTTACSDGVAPDDPASVSVVFSLHAPAGVSQEEKTSLEGAIKRLPQVSGTGGEVQVGRDLVNLLNLSEKEAGKRGDQFIASEMFLLALTEDKGEAGKLAKEAGLNRKSLEAAIDAVRGGETVGEPGA